MLLWQLRNMKNITATQSAFARASIHGWWMSEAQKADAGKPGGICESLKGHQQARQVQVKDSVRIEMICESGLRLSSWWCLGKMLTVVFWIQDLFVMLWCMIVIRKWLPLFNWFAKATILTMNQCWFRLSVLVYISSLCFWYLMEFPVPLYLSFLVPCFSFIS